MSERVCVGVIGDYDPSRPSHQATNDALNHAAERLSAALEIRWLPTQSLSGSEYQKTLEPFGGLWAAPGSPYQSMEGALGGIQFARERNRPFLGT